jgi:UDP-glucuronate 4-epimerase
VYGPGRDQGMTSTPTVAMLAAALGRSYHSPFGGRTLFNFAEDVAAAFIAASTSAPGGAITVDLPGVTADMADIVAAMEQVVPGASEMITYEQQTLPFPERIDSGADAPLGDLPLTSLDAGVATTIGIFQERIAAGSLVPEHHGLS